MYSPPSKSLLMMNILDILKKYSNSEHRLSQKDIADILHRDYSTTADRKAIKNNLMHLEELGFRLEYNETKRVTHVKDAKTGKVRAIENAMLSDFYLIRDFTDAELRLLIDGLMFSRHIPYNQCKELVTKLEGLSDKYFRSRIRHIARMPEDRTDNQELFLNIELLDEAISENKKVSFLYTEYLADGKIHIKTRPDGSKREYTVSPYQMAARDGKYYLICNHDKYNDISNYRLDRIKGMKILDERAKPFESLEGADGKPLDLTEYMKKHIYMFSSSDVRVRFRASKGMISNVIDMFGSGVSFSEVNGENVTVTAYVNEAAMVQFAKNYAPEVTVISPQRVVDRIKEDLVKALENYNDGER